LGHAVQLPVDDRQEFLRSDGVAGADAAK